MIKRIKMLEHSLIFNLSSPGLAENTTSRLRQEYQVYQRLLQAQHEAEQQYLRNQTEVLSNAIMNGIVPIRFALPEHVVCLPMMDCPGMDEILPVQARHQRVGSLLDRLTHPDLAVTIGRRLEELEKSTNQAVSVGAGLMRHALALQMVYHMSPAGKAVAYVSIDDDDIPNQPVTKNHSTVSELRPVIGNQSVNKGLLKHSVAPNSNEDYTSGFYLPQYVAFDEQNQLLVSDVQEAIADIQLMQRYLLILNSAISLAPYMVVDDEFQARHYGILGQLVNQGRAFARYQVEMLCRAIKQRAISHSLDRGLSLSIPYFNDRTLLIESYKFDIIPAGWVMFVPAFVVLAVRAQGAKIVQDTRLSQSTRRHILLELGTLEQAFLR
jgi:hypothetical protein